MPHIIVYYVENFKMLQPKRLLNKDFMPKRGAFLIF
jgi:hypothetical protein